MFIPKYNIYLISFFSLYQLLSGIICVNNTGNLVNSLFIGGIFNPFSSLAPFHNGVDSTM